MFNDPRDINRDVNYRDPNDISYRDPNYVAPADEVGWGLPMAILAVIVVIGGLFWFGHNTEGTQTAVNQPRVERTIPPVAPVAPAPVTPAPPAAPPQQ